MEQEICATADAFVGSADSSWTTLVAQQRAARDDVRGTSFERLLAPGRPFRETPQGFAAFEWLRWDGVRRRKEG